MAALPDPMASVAEVEAATQHYGIDLRHSQRMGMPLAGLDLELGSFASSPE